MTATTEVTTEAPPDPETGSEEEKPSTLRNLVEWVAILGAALLVAFVVKTFLVQAFFIPSGSMEPTLEIHDRVLVNKLSYKLHDIHRGDVVVFKRPPADPGTIKDLIKRVVAVEGDTVESREQTLYVNDRAVKEPFVKDTSIGSTSVMRTTVPPGHVFVMGDNRSNSGDSRVFGTVDEDRIVGRAFVKIWPLDSLKLL